MTMHFGLRRKIFFSLAALVVFLGGTIGLFVKLDFPRQLRQELEKRGVSIARHIANNSVSPILARDLLALKISAHQQLKTEEDILYIFFLGPHPREVLAHTFGTDFPVDLLDANPLPPGQGHSIRYLLTETGPIYDVAVPVASGGLGQVRLGISAAPVTRAVNILTGKILLVTLLLAAVTLCLGLPLAATLTRPLRELTRAVAAVAAGDLERQVPERSHDEFGRLAQTFNAMTRQLHGARTQLVERNEELATEVERRQQAEDRLAAQLNFLSTLMDELPCPVFYKDAAGVYLGSNRAFDELLGLRSQEIVGKTAGDLYPDPEIRTHVEVDRTLFENPGTCRYEAPLTTRGGQVLQILCQKATFKDREGRLAGLVGILIDVTSEREVDRLRSEFVSTTAHDFQTPLAAILGFCELLQSPEAEGSGNREDFLNIIRERAEFLSRLVDQFLDVSRIDAGRPLPLDPPPANPEWLVRTQLRHSPPGGKHRIELRFPSDPPQVLADPDRLGQVLENLIGNAVKYSPAGGRIQISGEVAGDFFRISVEDEGPGLPPEKVGRIFDKFYRADPATTAPTGTGLGLYISRAIIEAHGGRIEAANLPGHGLRITFDLPLAPA